MDSKYTLVPNVVFENYLPHLTIAQTKVLLVVIRQTLGWKKERDWISTKQLQTKTGCSRRSITDAIDSLVERGFVEVTDSHGYPLDTTGKRRGKTRLYFRYEPHPEQILQRRYAKAAQQLAQKMHITELSLQN